MSHRKKEEDGMGHAAVFGQATTTSGQSYKAPTIVIYASRVVPDLKLPHTTTLEL